MWLKNYLNESKQFKRRIWKAALVMLLLSSILFIRLFSLQVVQHKHYAELARSNQSHRIVIEANRGLIYDRNGVLLADNRASFTLNLILNRVQDLGETVRQLRKIINITDADLAHFKRALRQNNCTERLPLKQRLTQEEVSKFYLNNYKFSEVVIDVEVYRYYPLGEDLAHVVGYVGKVSKEELRRHEGEALPPATSVGKVGIEKYYENLLRGVPGYQLFEVEATRRVVNLRQVIPPVMGKSLYLTIDSGLQQVAKAALGTEKGAAVVIDPNNGEVLAFVSSPSYDPNLFVLGIDNSTFSKLQLSPARPMYNRVTKGQFPFASTIKPFLALQLLNTHVLPDGFQIADPGWFKLEHSSHIYHDWKKDGHGIVDLKRAIMVSCDVFFYISTLKLGIHRLADMLQQFGFGVRTGIDITEESAGIVASPEWKRHYLKKSWYLGDTVISSIGQGAMSATPLQLANGVAAIAMRGKRFKPHLLKSIQDGQGGRTEIAPVALPPVQLQESTAWDRVIEAMREVVNNPMGTAYYRFGEHDFRYTVAGKTGEAQLCRNASGGTRTLPKHLMNHNLFIAFAPVEKPQLAIAVITENSNLAVRTTRQILDYYLTQRRVAKPTN